MDLSLRTCDWPQANDTDPDKEKLKNAIKHHHLLYNNLEEENKNRQIRVELGPKKCNQKVALDRKMYTMGGQNR